MIRNSTHSKIHHLTWSVLVALTFIVIYGYSFNSGDQEEHLPYLYRLINPDLYPHDYLVPYQSSHFTVRFYFVWVLFGLSKIFPISWLVFTLHLFCLSIIGWSIGSITQLVSGKKESFLPASFLALLLLNNTTVGGNSIVDVQLTCSSFATALASISFYKAFRKQHYLAGIFAGLAALFQVLIGLHTILLISFAGILLADNDKLKIGFQTFFTGLLFSLPMLIPILINQSQLGNEDPTLFYAILYEYRNPNHYLPSFFPITDYIKTGILWLIAFLCCRLNKSLFTKTYSALLLFVLAGCLLYTFLLQNSDFMGIGKLQWFKTTTWVTFLSAVPIITLLIGYKVPRDFFLKISSISLGLRFVAIVVLLIILSNTAWIPSQKLSKRYQVGNYLKDDRMLMHEWIEKNTLKDCVILPQPQDDGFLCQAKRSVPVAFKGIVHEPNFLIPWYHKMVDVYGVKIESSTSGLNVLSEMADLFPKRADSTIIYAVAIDYRIWDESETDSSMIAGKKIIHRQGSLLLIGFDRKH